MSVEDFRKSNPDLSRREDELGAATDVQLSVVVLGLTDNFIDFTHMGISYRAALKDVIGLQRTENSSLGPKSATINFSRDALLVVQRAVMAVDLVNSIPFGFEKLSTVSEGSSSPSAKEKAWIIATGYDAQRGYASVEIAGRTFSTSTKTAGSPDDERADQFATIEEADRFGATVEVASGTFSTSTRTAGHTDDERADQFAQ